MSGAPVAKIFAEISLDYEPYTRAQKKLLQDATTTTRNIEKSYKDLGIKSAAEFDLMRAKISNAYTRIANDAKASAQDIIRAERAKAEQLKRIDTEQFGARSSMLTSFKNHWLGATASIFAAYTAMSKAWSLAEQYAQYDQSRQAFRSMAESMGADAERVFTRVRELSANMIDNKTLTESMNRALSLGIPISKLGDLMEVARAKARDMGISTSQAFDDIATGVGRASPLILDNLGLVMKVGSANEALATSLGKTVSELTDAEKKTAILNATLAAGQEAISRYDLETKTLKERMEALKATSQNIQLIIGQGITRASAMAVAAFQGLAGASLVVVSGFMKMTEYYNRFLSVFTFGETSDRYRIVAEEFKRDSEAAMEGAKDLFSQAADGFQLATASAEELLAATSTVKKAVAEVAEETEKVSAADKNLLEQIRQSKLEWDSVGLDAYEKEILRIESEAQKYAEAGASKVLIDQWVATEKKKAMVDAAEEISKQSKKLYEDGAKDQAKADEKAAAEKKRADEKALREQEDRHRKFLDNIQDLSASFYKDIATGQIRAFEDAWDRIKDYAISAMAEMAAKWTATKIGEWVGGSEGSSKVSNYMGIAGGALAVGYGIGQLLVNAFGIGKSDKRIGPLSSYTWQAGGTLPWDQMGEWHDQQGGIFDKQGYVTELAMTDAFNTAMAGLLDPTTGLPSWIQEMFQSAVNKSSITVDLTGKTFNFNSDADFAASANDISKAIQNQVLGSLSYVYKDMLPTVTGYLSGLDLSFLSPNSYLFKGASAGVFQSPGTGNFNPVEGTASYEQYYRSVGEFLSVFEDIKTQWNSITSAMSDGLSTFINEPLTSYESAMKSISDITKIAYDAAESLGISESALAGIREEEAIAIGRTNTRFANERGGIFEEIGRYMGDLTGTATEVEKALWPVTDRFESWRDVLIDKGIEIGSQEWIDFFDMWNKAIQTTTDSINDQTAAEKAAEEAAIKATAANEALARALEYYNRAAGVRGSYADLRDSFAFQQFSISGGASSDWYMAKIRDIQGQTVVTMDDLERVSELTGQWMNAAISEATNAAQASNQAAQSWTEVVDHTSEVMRSIDATVRGLTYGSLNVSLPGQKFNAASTDYAALFQKAMGGDTSAVEEFLSFTTTYLQSAQDRFKSSGQYQSIFASTLSDIEMIRSRASSGGFVEHIARTTEAVSSMANEVHIDLSGIGDILGSIESWSEDQLDALELTEVNLSDIDMSLEGIDKTLIDQLAEAREQNELLKQLLSKPMDTVVKMDGNKFVDLIQAVADSVDVERYNRDMEGNPLYS